MSVSCDFSEILTEKGLEATPFGVVFSVSRQGWFLGQGREGGGEVVAEVEFVSFWEKQQKMSDAFNLCKVTKEDAFFLANHHKKSLARKLLA